MKEDIQKKASRKELKSKVGAKQMCPKGPAIARTNRPPEVAKQWMN